MDKTEKLNELEEFQSEINSVKNLVQKLEDKYKRIHGISITDKIKNQKNIMYKMDDVLIDNDDVYLKIRIHNMNIEKILNCEIYEDIKYYFAKILCKYNIN
jgi:hypothetical protein